MLCPMNSYPSSFQSKIGRAAKNRSGRSRNYDGDHTNTNHAEIIHNVSLSVLYSFSVLHREVENKEPGVCEKGSLSVRDESGAGCDSSRRVGPFTNAMPDERGEKTSHLKRWKIDATKNVEEDVFVPETLHARYACVRPTKRSTRSSDTGAHPKLTTSSRRTMEKTEEEKERRSGPITQESLSQLSYSPSLGVKTSFHPRRSISGEPLHCSFRRPFSCSSAAVTTGAKKTSAEDFFRRFEFLASVGKGSYGLVRVVRHLETWELYAVKEMQKQLDTSHYAAYQTFRERRALATLSHPFFVTLHKAMQSKTKLYFVLKFGQGGDFQSFQSSFPWVRETQRALKAYAYPFYTEANKEEVEVLLKKKNKKEEEGQDARRALATRGKARRDSTLGFESSEGNREEEEASRGSQKGEPSRRVVEQQGGGRRVTDVNHKGEIVEADRSSSDTRDAVLGRTDEEGRRMVAGVARAHSPPSFSSPLHSLSPQSPCSLPSSVSISENGKPLDEMPLLSPPLLFPSSSFSGGAFSALPSESSFSGKVAQRGKEEEKRCRRFSLGASQKKMEERQEEGKDGIPKAFESADAMSTTSRGHEEASIPALRTSRSASQVYQEKKKRWKVRRKHPFQVRLLEGNTRVDALCLPPWWENGHRPDGAVERRGEAIQVEDMERAVAQKDGNADEKKKNAPENGPAAFRGATMPSSVTATTSTMKGICSSTMRSSTSVVADRDDGGAPPAQRRADTPLSPHGEGHPLPLLASSSLSVSRPSPSCGPADAEHDEGGYDEWIWRNNQKITAFRRSILGLPCETATRERTERRTTPSPNEAERGPIHRPMRGGDALVPNASSPLSDLQDPPWRRSPLENESKGPPVGGSPLQPPNTDARHLELLTRLDYSFAPDASRRLPLSYIAFFALELAVVMHYMHEEQYTHGDLKPANILLQNDGHILVSDFGTAKENPREKRRRSGRGNGQHDDDDDEEGEEEDERSGHHKIRREGRAGRENGDGDGEQNERHTPVKRSASSPFSFPPSKANKDDGTRNYMSPEVWLRKTDQLYPSSSSSSFEVPPCPSVLYFHSGASAMEECGGSPTSGSPSPRTNRSEKRHTQRQEETIETPSLGVSSTMTDGPSGTAASTTRRAHSLDSGGGTATAPRATAETGEENDIPRTTSSSTTTAVAVPRDIASSSFVLPLPSESLPPVRFHPLSSAGREERDGEVCPFPCCAVDVCSPVVAQTPRPFPSTPHSAFTTPRTPGQRQSGRGRRGSAPQEDHRSPLQEEGTPPPTMVAGDHCRPAARSGHITGDHLADWWSYGCVVFEMCNGRLAFDGPSVYTISERILMEDVKVRPEEDFRLTALELHGYYAQVVQRYAAQKTCVTQYHDAFLGTTASSRATQAMDRTSDGGRWKPYFSSTSEFLFSPHTASPPVPSSKDLTTPSSPSTPHGQGTRPTMPPDAWHASDRFFGEATAMACQSRDFVFSSCLVDLLEAMHYLKHLVLSLLQRDPAKRLYGAARVWNHPFFHCHYVVSQLYYTIFLQRRKQWVRQQRVPCRAAVDGQDGGRTEDVDAGKRELPSAPSTVAPPMPTAARASASFLGEEEEEKYDDAHDREGSCGAGDVSLPHRYYYYLSPSFSSGRAAHTSPIRENWFWQLDGQSTTSILHFIQMLHDTLHRPRDWKAFLETKRIPPRYLPYLRCKDDLRYFPNARNIHGQLVEKIQNQVLRELRHSAHDTQEMGKKKKKKVKTHRQKPPHEKRPHVEKEEPPQLQELSGTRGKSGRKRRREKGASVTSRHVEAITEDTAGREKKREGGASLVSDDAAATVKGRRKHTHRRRRVFTYPCTTTVSGGGAPHSPLASPPLSMRCTSSHGLAWDLPCVNAFLYARFLSVASVDDTSTSPERTARPMWSTTTGVRTTSTAAGPPFSFSPLSTTFSCPPSSSSPSFSSTLTALPRVWYFPLSTSRLSCSPFASGASSSSLFVSPLAPGWTPVYVEDWECGVPSPHSSLPVLLASLHPTTSPTTDTHPTARKGRWRQLQLFSPLPLDAYTSYISPVLAASSSSLSTSVSSSFFRSGKRRKDGGSGASRPHAPSFPRLPPASSSPVGRRSKKTFYPSMAAYLQAQYVNDIGVDDPSPLLPFSSPPSWTSSLPFMDALSPPRPPPPPVLPPTPPTRLFSHPRTWSSLSASCPTSPSVLPPCRSPAGGLFTPSSSLEAVTSIPSQAPSSSSLSSSLSCAKDSMNNAAEMECFTNSDVTSFTSTASQMDLSPLFSDDLEETPMEDLPPGRPGSDVDRPQTSSSSSSSFSSSPRAPPTAIAGKPATHHFSDGGDGHTSSSYFPPPPAGYRQAFFCQDVGHLPWPFTLHVMPSLPPPSPPAAPTTPNSVPHAFGLISAPFLLPPASSGKMSPVFTNAPLTIAVSQPSPRCGGDESAAWMPPTISPIFDGTEDIPDTAVVRLPAPSATPSRAAVVLVGYFLAVAPPRSTPDTEEKDEEEEKVMPHVSSPFPSSVSHDPPSCRPHGASRKRMHGTCHRMETNGTEEEEDARPGGDGSGGGGGGLPAVERRLTAVLCDPEDPTHVEFWCYFPDANAEEEEENHHERGRRRPRSMGDGTARPPTPPMTHGGQAEAAMGGEGTTLLRVSPPLDAKGEEGVSPTRTPSFVSLSSSLRTPTIISVPRWSWGSSSLSLSRPASQDRTPQDTSAVMRPGVSLDRTPPETAARLSASMPVPPTPSMPSLLSTKSLSRSKCAGMARRPAARLPTRIAASWRVGARSRHGSGRCRRAGERSAASTRGRGEYPSFLRTLRGVPYPLQEEERLETSMEAESRSQKNNNTHEEEEEEEREEEEKPCWTRQETMRAHDDHPPPRRRMENDRHTPGTAKEEEREEEEKEKGKGFFSSFLTPSSSSSFPDDNGSPRSTQENVFPLLPRYASFATRSLRSFFSSRGMEGRAKEPQCVLSRASSRHPSPAISLHAHRFHSVLSDPLPARRGGGGGRPPWFISASPSETLPAWKEEDFRRMEPDLPPCVRSSSVGLAPALLPPLPPSPTADSPPRRHTLPMAASSSTRPPPAALLSSPSSTASCPPVHRGGGEGEKKEAVAGQASSSPRLPIPEQPARQERAAPQEREKNAFEEALLRSFGVSVPERPSSEREADAEEEEGEEMTGVVGRGYPLVPPRPTTLPDAPPRPSPKAKKERRDRSTPSSSPHSRHEGTRRRQWWCAHTPDGTRDPRRGGSGDALPLLPSPPPSTASTDGPCRDPPISSSSFSISCHPSRRAGGMGWIIASNGEDVEVEGEERIRGGECPHAAASPLEGIGEGKAWMSDQRRRTRREEGGGLPPENEEEEEEEDARHPTETKKDHAGRSEDSTSAWEGLDTLPRRVWRYTHGGSWLATAPSLLLSLLFSRRGAVCHMHGACDASSPSLTNREAKRASCPTGETNHTTSDADTHVRHSLLSQCSGDVWGGGAFLSSLWSLLLPWWSHTTRVGSTTTTPHVTSTPVTRREAQRGRGNGRDAKKGGKRSRHLPESMEEKEEILKKSKKKKKHQRGRFKASPLVSALPFRADEDADPSGTVTTFHGRQEQEKLSPPHRDEESASLHSSVGEKTKKKSVVDMYRQKHRNSAIRDRRTGSLFQAPCGFPARSVATAAAAASSPSHRHAFPVAPRRSSSFSSESWSSGEEDSNEEASRSYFASLGKEKTTTVVHATALSSSSEEEEGEEDDGRDDFLAFQRRHPSSHRYHSYSPQEDHRPCSSPTQRRKARYNEDDSANSSHCSSEDPDQCYEGYLHNFTYTNPDDPF